MQYRSNKKKSLLIIPILSLLMILSSCSLFENSAEKVAQERYLDMIELLTDYDEFSSGSKYFDVSVDIAKIDNGYRFYVIIDNPKVSMYDVEAVAIEKDVDYTKNMAASIGIFEEKDFSLVPNQCNPANGFVKGISISGVSESPDTQIYLLVQWNNGDMSTVYREFICLPASFGGINE